MEKKEKQKEQEQKQDYEPSLKEKLMMKTMLWRVRKRKEKLLRKKTETAIHNAKQSILETIDFLEIEHDGRELTKEDVETLNDEEIIELFDVIIDLLEELYTKQKGDKKK